MLIASLFNLFAKVRCLRVSEIVGKYSDYYNHQVTLTSRRGNNFLPNVLISHEFRQVLNHEDITSEVYNFSVSGIGVMIW